MDLEIPLGKRTKKYRFFEILPGFFSYGAIILLIVLSIFNPLLASIYLLIIGIQQVGSELYPSWWNKKHNNSSQKMTFDKVSKKKATNCTPDGAKEEIDVVRTTDPLTKKESFSVPAGYDANAEDDFHKCSDTKPQISSISVSNSGNKYTISE